MTADGSFYLFAGTDQRINFGRSLVRRRPITSVGFYEERETARTSAANSNFAPGVAVGRRLRGGSRVSFGFFHLSNSSYYRRNPGE